MYATNMHGSQRYGVLPYTHHLYDVELALREFGPLPHVRFDRTHIGRKVRIFGSNQVGFIDHFQDPNLPWHTGETAIVFVGEDTLSPHYVHPDNGSLYDPDGPTEEEMIVAAWLHDVVEDTDAKERDVEELFGDWPRRLVAAVTSEEAPNRRMRVALTLPKTRAAGVYAVRLKLADRIANARNGGGSLKMYAKEHDEFRRGLYTPGENEDMWTELDMLFKGGSR